MDNDKIKKLENRIENLEKSVGTIINVLENNRMESIKSKKKVLEILNSLDV